MGPTELVLLGALAFVLFGAKKLPELARSLGSSVTEFKKAVQESSENPEREDDASRDARVS